MKQPRLVSVDETHFTIEWDLPRSNGGCPITGYAIYRDNGLGGFIITPVDVASVEDNPYLFKHTATIAGSETGKTFRVKVEAINVYGSVLSPALSFVLADVPGKPTPAPSVDITNTTTSQIKVNFANTNPDNGGSPLIATELQMDDGDAGEFRIIFTTSEFTTYVVTDGIERGKNYRFRYRVRNVNGWSPFSEVSFIRAFSTPNIPPAPVFDSATDTTATFKLYYTDNDNGSRIKKYELWLDDGDDLESDFHKVLTYDGLSQTHTLDKTLDSLGLPGTIYRLKYRAQNVDLVYSDYSKEVIFALGSVPSKPSTPVKND